MVIDILTPVKAAVLEYFKLNSFKLMTILRKFTTVAESIKDATVHLLDVWKIETAT